MRHQQIISAFAALQLASCASMIRGTDQHFALSTEPPYATVQVNEEEYVTPVVLRLPRNENARLLLSKEGFQNEEVTFKYRFDGACISNAGLLPLAPIGCLADSISGGTYSLTQNHLHLELKSRGSTGTEGSKARVIDWGASQQGVWDNRVDDLINSEKMTTTYAWAGGILTGTGVVATLFALMAYSMADWCWNSKECEREAERDRRRIRWYIAGGMGTTIAGIGFYAAAAEEGSDMDRLATEMNRMNPTNPPPQSGQEQTERMTRVGVEIQF